MYLVERADSKVLNILTYDLTLVYGYPKKFYMLLLTPLMRNNLIQYEVFSYDIDRMNKGRLVD